MSARGRKQSWVTLVIPFRRGKFGSGSKWREAGPKTFHRTHPRGGEGQRPEEARLGRMARQAHGHPAEVAEVPAMERVGRFDGVLVADPLQAAWWLVLGTQEWTPAIIEPPSAASPSPLGWMGPCGSAS